MSQQLIGIGGYATAGKDALADFLVDFGWFKTYMSAPLEQALLILNPLIPVYPGKWINRDAPKVLDYDSHLVYSDLHELVGYDESKKNIEVRRLLQVLGTEIGRNKFGEDCWVDMAFGVVDREIVERPVVITGIRYANELKAVRSRGGLAVWVNRAGRGPVNAHTSDNTLGPDDFDKVIHNDGSLVDLEAQAYALTEYTAAKVLA